MRIEFTPEQQALQDELREYFAGLMTPERRAQLGNVGDEVGEGVAHKEIIRQMGRDGWLGIGWPRAYGGQGRGPVEQLIFLEEAARAGAPIPLVTLNTVGPTLAEYGSD